MARLRTDEKQRTQISRGPAIRAVWLEAEAFLHQLFTDIDGGLELAIVLAAVAHGWRVEGVQRVVHRVVVMQHRLLIRRQILALSVAARFGIAGACFDGPPLPR